MKTTSLLLAFGFLLPASVPAQVNESSRFEIVERGDHHRVWQSVTMETDAKGKRHYRTNSYTELETGMHYLKDGQWLESREEIEIVAGDAVARHGRHQVIFSANCNSPVAIDMLTPDGKRLQSRVLGLAYFDGASGKMVWIAELKDSVGQLLPPNQVIYIDAFTGLKAHLRYTYTKAGFEQDVIIREKPPTPSKFGLNPSTTRLQVMTEFLDPPTPKVEPKQVDGVTDEQLNFGDMVMGAGKAFSLLGGGQDSIPVSKGWGQLAGRVFLVEEASYPLLEPLLRTLPAPQASLKASPKGRLYAVSNQRQLPPVQTVKKKSTQPMMVASLPLSGQGVVLDYTTLSSGANQTFRGDMTYYVSGTVNLTGTTTIEGGTVVKYANTATAGINFTGPLVCQTSAYRPAIFTSKDDNSVGEIISGSNNNPVKSTANMYLVNGGTQANSYKHLRLAYAGTGVQDPFLVDVWHCRFLNCTMGIFKSSGNILLRNVLFAQCTTGLKTINTIDGQHLTVDGCTRFADSAVTGGNITNSLFTAVTTLGTVTLAPSSWQNASSSGVYQTVGAGNYYLAANSPHCNVGSTSVVATLTKDLKSRTTYPPVVLVNHFTEDTVLFPQAQRDTDTPDRGYHYDPLDYCWTALNLTNATLQLTNGVAVGIYGNKGITLQKGGKLVSEGLPTALNRLVRYDAVQEQSIAWGTLSDPSSLMNVATTPTTSLPNIQMRFTDISLLGGTLTKRYVLTLEGVNLVSALSIRDSQVRGGYLLFWVYNNNANQMIVSLTNNLLERVDFTLMQGYQGDTTPVGVYLWNNLVRNSTLALNGGNSGVQWRVHDNFFDTNTLSGSGSQLTHTHNGYRATTQLPGSTSGNVTVTSTEAHLIGALGNYYYPSTGSGLNLLRNVGSRTVTAAGLYHQTTTTDQNKDTGQVDIGLHYVAVDTIFEKPKDQDGDGWPDYFEDANGNSTHDAANGETNWQVSENGTTGVPGLLVFTPFR